MTYLRGMASCGTRTHYFDDILTTDVGRNGKKRSQYQAREFTKIAGYKLRPVDDALVGVRGWLAVSGWRHGSTSEANAPSVIFSKHYLITLDTTAPTAWISGSKRG